VLRIHFTTEDLVRTRVAPGPDPLWETALSLTQLQTRKGAVVFDRWRGETRARLAALGDAPRVLLPLVPPTGYFPDFLTPAEGSGGVEAGLEALRATPKPRLDDELRMLADHRRLPTWTEALVDRDGKALALLADAVRVFHDAAIAPEWSRIETHVEADRGVRAQALLAEGPEGLLRSLGAGMRWRAPVLEVDYPVDRDLVLGGRGLLLMPSFFNWGRPVTLQNEDLRPVLVYSTSEQVLNSDRTSDRALVALLGRTRATVLQSVRTGATTAELARRVGTSQASASRHATVLREAGLLTTQRRGNTVLHTLTPLGVDLLNRTGSTSG
jgi:DNA-binding transcriptional ArsR family regulator